MANTGSLEAGMYIAIANVIDVESKDKTVSMSEPTMYWFKAEVTKVVARGDDTVTVRVYFSKNDRDNKVEWILTEDMFCDSYDVSLEMVERSTRDKLCAYGWRWCTKSARQRELVRKMSEAEMKALVRIVEGKPDLEFAEFTYNQLLFRFWEAWEAHSSGKKAKMLTMRDAQLPVAETAGPSTVTAAPQAAPVPAPAPAPRAPRANAPYVVGQKRKPQHSLDSSFEEMLERFNEYKRTMNAKMMTLEGQIDAIKKMYEDSETKLAAITAQKKKAQHEGVKAVRHTSLDFIIPDEHLSAADCVKLGIHEKLLSGKVTTFVRTVIDEKTRKPKTHRISRCIRQLKVSSDGTGPACKSKKMDASVNYYINHDADMLPVPIMEIDPDVCNMSLCDAIKRWKYYCVCKVCMNDTNIKCVPAGKYLDLARLEDSPKIAECVWDTCVMCMDRKKKQVYENVPLCECCYSVAIKDGNSDGGDNRLPFLLAVTYRFPWIKFFAEDWGQLCAAVKEKRTMEGPDCVFRVHVPMLGYNIYIVNEEDGGNGHRSYKVDEEAARQAAIINVLTKQHPRDVVLFTRTDPKADFRTPDDRVFKPSFVVRMLVLRSWITWYIKRILSGKPVPKTIVLYLFYSYDNKHFLEAKKVAKASKGKVVVGYAHTYPQEKLECTRDWMYCLTPNEGVLFRALAHSWQTNGLVKAHVSSAFPDTSMFK